jgi:hypothetical protein
VTKPSKSWVVVVDAEAMVDFESVKSHGERKSLFNAIDKLGYMGPQLGSPHLKSLTGETDLFELRPRQGRAPSRAIFARRGDYFVVLAVASKKSRLDAAIGRARVRLSRHRFLDNKSIIKQSN